MPARIVPCDSCGSPIPDADLETGQAVTLLGKRYCSGCKADAIRNVSLEDLSGAPPARPQQAAPPVKPAALRPAAAKRAAPSPLAPPRVERKTPARKTVPAAAARSRAPFLAVTAGVIVLLCIAGAYLAFRESPPAPSTPPKSSGTPPSSPAAAAGREAQAR